MNGRYLLDTNIVIALFDGDQFVVDQIDQAAEIFVPSIGVGELYYGAFNSGKRQTNIDRVDQLRTQVTILDCDDFTAKY
jgi:tRNA(fMet)-specific endonuclease VapC